MARPQSLLAGLEFHDRLNSAESSKRLRPRRSSRLNFRPMVDPQADAEILERMARQDTRAVGDLYDRFGRPIYSFVFKMLGSARDAEEVVQDVFLAAWRNAASFEPRTANAFTWLVAIARNKSIDRIRHTGRRIPAPPADPDQSAPETPDASADPATSTATSDEARLVRAWVAELPPNQREAVELAFFEGLTHPEIAERLSESQGTVKSRVRLAMEKLRLKVKGGLNDH